MALTKSKALLKRIRPNSHETYWTWLSYSSFLAWMKNILRLFGDITRVDAETRTIEGYASLTPDCGDGFILPRAVLEAATPDYVKWANVREMHQPRAVGTTEVTWDETGPLLRATIVDDEAWKKVTTGVYKAFSVGVKVRRAKKVGSKLEALDATWFETSLVDRPADPQATFSIVRLDGEDESGDIEVEDDAPAPAPSMAGVFRGVLMTKLKSSEQQTLIREAISCFDSFCWGIRYGESRVPEGMTLRQAFADACNDLRDYVGPLLDQMPVTRADGEVAPMLIEEALRLADERGDYHAQIQRAEAAEARILALDEEVTRLTAELAKPTNDDARPVMNKEGLMSAMRARLEEEKAKTSTPAGVDFVRDFSTATEAEKKDAFLELTRQKTGGR